MKKIIIWDCRTKKVIYKFDSIELAIKELKTTKGTLETCCREQKRLLLNKREDYKACKNLVPFYLDDFDENLFLKKFLNLKYECKICSSRLKNLRSLVTHIQSSHELTSKEYAINYLYNGKQPLCKICNSETRYVSLMFKEYCLKHSKEAMKLGGKKGGQTESWNKGKTKFDDDRIMKHSLLVSGENNHFYGKHHTKKTKILLSTAKKLSEEIILERLNKRSNDFIFLNFDYEKYMSRQHQKIGCICVKCNRKQNKTLQSLERGALCKFCYPFTVSKAEIEIGDYIENQLKQKIIRNDRKLISPKELDILSMEKKLAIEYNGLYWHKDDGSKGFNKFLHQEKTDLCKQKNIKLFHIFSDEWEFKKTIIKNMISYKLSLVSNKIGARKCLIKQISKEEGKEFFNNSHISGDTKAKVYFALTYKDEIISAVSLREPLQKKYSNMIELARFATKGDWNVSGGFSKLLNEIKRYCFVNNYKGIISYADLRTGTGNVYEKSGFNKIGETGISYWYTDGIKRYDRFSYRAKNNKTEKEIAKENNVYKIYGCKNAIYILNLL